MAVKKKAAYAAMPKASTGPKMTAKPAGAAKPMMKMTPLPATAAKPNIQNAILKKKTSALATAKSAARAAASPNAALAKQAAAIAKHSAVSTATAKQKARKSVIGATANQLKTDYDKMIKERGGAGYGEMRSMMPIAGSNKAGISRPKRARKVHAPKMVQYQDDEIKNTVNKQRRKSAAIKSYL